MKKNAKRFLWVGLLAALAGGGWWGYTHFWGGAEDQKKVEVIAVTRGNIEDSVSAQGKLEPKDYVDVGVQVSGQLKKLYVEIGDTVKAGDLLAEIDPQTYQSKVDGNLAQIKSLQAQLEQQKAQAAYDKLQFERTEKLVKAKAVSEQEAEEKEKAYRVSEATVASLEAQIEEAQASLDTNQINLGYTKIYAPMDGIISDQIAREGQTLNANQTTPTVVQVANLDVMTIRAEIAEADVMRLKAGMESDFSTLGSLERKWKGTIRQILPTPEEVNDVVLYNALIDVENKDRQLMNGMSTQNTFIVGKAENVLIVPTKALGRRVPARDDDAKGTAYVVRVMGADGAAQEREVYVGLVTRAKAEVKSGLREGEQVVTSGEVAESGAKKQGGGPRMPGMARL